jgi:glycosyltransferase involved in cell wall biosynthesis
VKIAILGSRGIPARYSGFETCAEELGKRLVKRGHDVTVYCCRLYCDIKPKRLHGIRRIILPTIRKKNLEKVFYSILCLLHVTFTKNRIVLMLGLNFPFFFFLPRIFGKIIIVNVDGLEWKRRKWGRLAAKYLLYCEKIVGLLADRVVTDAKYIQDYYLNTYGIDSAYMAYGVENSSIKSQNILKKLGLKKDEYILYVSRFAPENNPLLIREAFDSLVNPSKRLVMVGDSQFDRSYVKQVKATNNPRIIFTGGIYGQGYLELISNAYVYIQATEVGGTHPALVEAMGYGNFILANDVPEHREVLGDAGMYYQGKEDLIQKIKFLLTNDDVIKKGRTKATEIAKEKYSWEKVTTQYAQLFEAMVHGSAASHMVNQ